ncbi:MAG: nucleotidyltransferase domain-containing protein [Clostridia bacterium]|jgi:predicted nucleotidyltransferase|nr:nucleotidyltransferase domain-containing protein [Clostridia bacterium]
MTLHQTILKNEIISKLIQRLEPLEYIYALWVEGSHANGTADEYSDIDFWVDFEDTHENDAIEMVEKALLELSEFDYKYVMKHGHPQIRQRIYHLKGSSEYLMIDFCWQLHSRPKDDYSYYLDDPIEAVKVLFNKDNIIRYKELDLDEFTRSNKAGLVEMQYRYTQHARVMKYVLRNQYIEASAYYQRYVIEPLVFLLRMIYTPAYTDYGCIHISNHIPKELYEKLEYLIKISSLDDISKKITEAEAWFSELNKRVELE